MVRLLPWAVRSAALAAVVSLGVDATAATEDHFIYVDGMPPVEGEPRQSRAGGDAASGLRYRQATYVQDLNGLYVVTHVTEATCGASVEGREADPFIVALQYLPKRPMTFQSVTLHDVYKDVYVRDPEGRVRLYVDMSAPQMVELTNRLKPSCLGA